ncbi:OB-fold nucleic acid binding domain protein [Aspergillus bombycis]|uniref:CST complex subunit STN1 n=1 Tax=Aspergillus bombycis TaxID=109264 RepID=A0A1F8A0J8_9EURO|nr:OB-fold nucleic acid binding domain protein [Aspergillus bombycis]OGM44865.1 OB-fold nucleic acid binding domain protein [Aspergillus bombycis]
MATVDDGELVFYPAFCFRASPTHFAWVKMGAVDVHLLKRRAGFEDQSTFFYMNHPIRFVSLVGIIVARTEYPTLTILTVDDSSGATIDIIVLKAPVTDDDGDQSVQSGRRGGLQSACATKHVAATNKTTVDTTALVPGVVVQVKGTLSMFRATMQIQLERVSVVQDTNAEIQFLDQRSRYLVEVLSVPWSLAEEEVERLRSEADDEEERLEEEQERIKRRQRRRIEREEKDQRRIQKLWEREERLRAKEALYSRDAGAKFMREFEERKV